jgi:hypothetical protein
MGCLSALIRMMFLLHTFINKYLVLIKPIPNPLKIASISKIELAPFPSALKNKPALLINRTTTPVYQTSAASLLRVRVDVLNIKLTRVSKGKVTALEYPIYKYRSVLNQPSFLQQHLDSYKGQSAPSLHMEGWGFEPMLARDSQAQYFFLDHLPVFSGSHTGFHLKDCSTDED